MQKGSVAKQAKKQSFKTAKAVQKALFFGIIVVDEQTKYPSKLSHKEKEYASKNGWI